MHYPIVHSWTEQYSHRPPEGKDTSASAAVNLSYFSHSSQVTHSAPEITTRKENKNPPLASLLNVPFICGRLIHHYRIRALSYSRASLHFPPPRIRSETRPERRQLWNLLLFNELVSSSLHLPGLESTRIRGAGLFLRLLLQSSTGALWVNLPRAAR